MFTNYIVFILILFTSKLYAYETGEQFCKNNPSNDFGQFHSITDESLLKNQIIKVHSYTKKKFDPKKETILFISGGPGTNPKTVEFDMADYNIIFFEPRGIGCSRPLDVKDLLNPNFYSSEKVASDIALILEDYGVEQAIIYGHSYGTVVASIFASRFPAKTKKVVLEGIIGLGDLGIWKSERRRALLQNLYHELPNNQKLQIDYYNHSEKVPQSWFSVVGNMMLYLDDGVNIYKEFLSNVLAMEEDSFIGLVNNFYAPKGFIDTSAELASDGEVFFGMITCQELSGASPESSMNLIFDDSHTLQWNNENSVSESYCRTLGLSETQSRIDLAKYPIFVPVIYLAGENDGATDLEQAFYHYRNVAFGSKDFYVLSSGGHLPNLGALRDDRVCASEDDCLSLKKVKAQVNFFKHLLKSPVRLSEEQIEHFNLELDLKWKSVQ